MEILVNYFTLSTALGGNRYFRAGFDVFCNVSTILMLFLFAFFISIF